jgi:hypothetical protein
MWHKHRAYLTEKLYICGKWVFVIENCLHNKTRMILTIKNFLNIQTLPGLRKTRLYTNSTLRKLFHEAHIKVFEMSLELNFVNVSFLRSRCLCPRFSYLHEFLFFYEAQTCIHMCITVGISIYAKFWLRRALETERLPKPGSVHYNTYKNENEL